MRPPIVILGTGRCGSSLLQRLLNTHTQVAIWGEHWGFLAPLAEAYFRLSRGRDIAEANPEIQHPRALWALDHLRRSESKQRRVNPFWKPEVRDGFARLLLDLYGGAPELRDLHWGFKEIRYGPDQRILELLDELLPGFRLVIAARHPRDTVASMMLAWSWRPPDGAEAWSASELKSVMKASCVARLQHWMAVTSYLLDFLSNAPQRACLVRYEDMLRDPQTEVGRVFDFIDLDPPPPDRIEPVLALRPGEAAVAQDHRSVAKLVEKRIEAMRSPLAELAGKLGYVV
jgi:hypothetical protein